jgi:cytoskeletal protein RodZ
MFVTESHAARGAQPPGWAISIQAGEALWRGRLRVGLSLEDIAGRIGADPDVVAALENSDFDRLSSRDQSIAIARAYAEIVGLPRKWVVLALANELVPRDEWRR